MNTTQDGQPRERKTFPVEVIDINEELGEVEAIVAVMGNIDDGDDRIWPGAFTKTISERMGRIRVLDNHNHFSINDVIAKPVEMREVSRGELPMDLRTKYPEATGGLQVKMQFDKEIENSWGAFRRIKNGFINEYSIGYDPYDEDYETIGDPNSPRRIRNIRTIRLWDASPVVWGMNAATTTVAAKGAEVDGEEIAPPLEIPADSEPETQVVETESEAKAGRTISAASARRILAAVDELRGLLIDAGVLPGEDEEDEGKQEEIPAQSEAGPQSAPTDVEIETQRKLIDIERVMLENKRLQAARQVKE
jgi:HK97 family phage prohead protease